MWKDILALFKSEGLCEEAFDEAILMLQTCEGMYRDSIRALHEKGQFSQHEYVGMPGQDFPIPGF